MTVHRRRGALTRSIALLLLTSLVVLVGACGGEADSDVAGVAAAAGDGVRVVSADAAAAMLAEAPPGLVVLDVRTPQEFADGHLEGATMLDFYEPDFADRLADLDPDVPYLLYCRSGNRSGQARELMRDLGFVDVADIDGGVVAWAGSGLPLVR